MPFVLNDIDLCSSDIDLCSSDIDLCSSGIQFRIEDDFYYIISTFYASSDTSAAPPFWRPCICLLENALQTYLLLEFASAYEVYNDRYVQAKRVDIFAAFTVAVAGKPSYTDLSCAALKVLQGRRNIAATENCNSKSGRGLASRNRTNPPSSPKGRDY